jgi:hypothetical protein
LCVVEPDVWTASHPEGDDRRVVVLGKLLEIDPWFALWEEVDVANDGKWEGAWWLD